MLYHDISVDNAETNRKGQNKKTCGIQLLDSLTCTVLLPNGRKQSKELFASCKQYIFANICMEHSFSLLTHVSLKHSLGLDCSVWLVTASREHKSNITIKPNVILTENKPKSIGIIPYV